MKFVWPRAAWMGAVFTAIAGCGGEGESPVSGDTGVVLTCGNGMLDAGESCDDGNRFGGDGCTSFCTDEDAPGEGEPNDELADARSVAFGTTVAGGLPIGDRDCFAYTVDDDQALIALQEPLDGNTCVDALAIDVLDSTGARLASGLPLFDTNCGSLDANTDSFARHFEAGDIFVCVESAVGEAVRDYRFSVEAVDSCTGLPAIPPAPGLDNDDDLEADPCDSDDDNDGVPDDVDNCPLTPNGSEIPFAWDTSADGFIRLWLALGPFEGEESDDECLPTELTYAFDGDDALAAPVFGDSASGEPWVIVARWPHDDAFVDFNSLYTAVEPREAYAGTWVHSDVARSALLSVGSDDGHRVWFNNTQVDETAGCHGASADQYLYPVELVEGWNPLMVKVYDRVGGWRTLVRFLDVDSEEPLPDLQVSIAGATAWADNQGDADGDGIGDACDLDPL